jgi:hypothetical protein
MAKRFKPAPLTDEQRTQRRREEQDLTERAVALLRSSDGWQRWLVARGHAGLRRLSLRNQCMVMLADPDATYVAGFRGWLRLGYVVSKGSRSAIRIWAKRALLRQMRGLLGAVSVVGGIGSLLW